MVRVGRAAQGRVNFPDIELGAEPQVVGTSVASGAQQEIVSDMDQSLKQEQEDRRLSRTSGPGSEHRTRLAAALAGRIWMVWERLEGSDREVPGVGVAVANTVETVPASPM